MRILLIEDDASLCQLLALQLEQKDYQVDTCMDGEDARYYLKQNAHDLILLDRMLPHVDGVTLLQEFRKMGYATPVIFLTALGELGDKITGLDAGADDYLVKPFAFEELLARIRCITRRPQELLTDLTLTYCDLTYHPDTNILAGEKGSCTLSKKEGQLLEFFLKNSVQTLPRMLLLTRVWGPDAEVEEGNLDNYMYFIRRRLKSVSAQVSIKTIRGVGYQLEAAHV